MNHDTRICKDCAEAFTVKSHSQRTRCAACRDAIKDAAAQRDADRIAGRYEARMIEAKLAAYAARKSGDAEAAAAAVADVVFYREAMEKARVAV